MVDSFTAAVTSEYYADVYKNRKPIPPVWSKILVYTISLIALSIYGQLSENRKIIPEIKIESAHKNS